MTLPIASVDQVAVVVRDLDEAMRHEFLDAHGEGLHHLGYYVNDLDAAIGDMEAQGFAVLQSGRGNGIDGDGGYAYFETRAALGCILEAIELPRAMPDPERIHPA